MPPAQNNSQVISVDDQLEGHLQKIAQNVSEATNQEHSAEDLTPPHQKNPIPQLQIQEEPKEQENTKEKSDVSWWQNFTNGLRGRPRVGKTMPFLETKMKWLSRKNKGATVSLK